MSTGSENLQKFINHCQPFNYTRIIHFADTDAAGVVYFANILSICHEAYEALLQAKGVKLQDFFRNSLLAIPIVHAEVDFYQPLFCGDQINIKLETQLINDTEFSIIYQVFSQDFTRLLARAKTQHVSINPQTRKRTNLSVEMLPIFEN